MTNQVTKRVPRTWHSDHDHLSIIADIVNSILAGKIESYGSVTLTANSTTTTLNDPNIGINSRIVIQPTTANAAAAIANVYFGTPGAGTVTINHSSNAQTDRTFKYVVLG